LLFRSGPPPRWRCPPVCTSTEPVRRANVGSALMRHKAPLLSLPTLPTLLLSASLCAQVVTPADKQKKPDEPQNPPVIVEGRQVSDLREEDRIGSQRHTA